MQLDTLRQATARHLISPALLLLKYFLYFPSQHRERLKLLTVIIKFKLVAAGLVFPLALMNLLTAARQM